MQTRYQRPPKLFHPRYWLTWAGIALAFVLTGLPQPVRQRLAGLLGRSAKYLAPRRVRIARINLALCFPDWTPEARAQLLKANLRSTAEGLLETGTTWLHPEKLEALTVRFSGLEHLDRAKNDPGILILGMHFATLDLAGALLSRQKPFNVMYKTNKNPVLEWLMQRGRGHHFNQVIDQHNIRGVIKSLKAGNRLWYAPDQDYGLPERGLCTVFRFTGGNHNGGESHRPPNRCKSRLHESLPTHRRQLFGGDQGAGRPVSNRI